MKVEIGKRLHLDRRANQLAAEPGDDDELLDSINLADWFGCSPQWVDNGRTYGYGPPYVELAPRMIRYRRGDVRKWLAERARLRTNGYIIQKRRRAA